MADLISTGSLISTKVRVIGKDIVDAKLLAAGPRLLAQNRLMVTAVLEQIKPIVVAQTPLGPGHFGYHLRDNYRIHVQFQGITTTGKLLAPVQGYWREYGTKGRFRGPDKRRSYVAAFMSVNYGTGGERAFRTAHKAASLVKRVINFYYGGLAAWWRA